MKNAKKFFALLCTMAMVMSLFSGVVLAAAETGSTAVISFTGMVGTVGTVKLTVTDDDTDLGSVKVTFPNGLEVQAINDHKVTKADGTAVGTINSGNLSGGTAGQTFEVTGLGSGVKSVNLEIKVKPTTAGIYTLTGTAIELGTDTVETVTGVLCAGTAGYTVTLDPMKFVENKNISTNIVVKKDGVVVGDTMKWEVFDATTSTTVLNGYGATGNFTTIINIPAAGHIYVFKVGKADGSEYGYVVVDQVTQSFNFELTVDSLGDVYRKDVKTITGKLVNNKGEAIVGANVYLYGPAATNTTNASNPGAFSNPLTSSRTAIDGTFQMDAYFAHAGLYPFVIEWDHDNNGSTPAVKYHSNVFVKVKASDDLSISADSSTVPNTAVDATGSKQFDLTIKRSSTALNGQSVMLDLTRPDGTKVSNLSKTTDGNGVISVSASDFGYGGGVTAWPAGEYKIVVKYEHKSTDNAPTTPVEYYNSVTTYTKTVASPGKVNASLALAKHDGSNYVSVGGSKVYPSLDKYQVTLSVKDKLGASIQPTTSDADEIKSVVFTISGPIDRERTVDTSKGDSLVVGDVYIQQGGTLTIKGTATMGNDSKYDFEVTQKIEGYVVKTEKTLGAVGDQVELVATVTDASGNPINNALVTWESKNGKLIFKEQNSDGTFGSAKTKITYDGATKNVTDGVYKKVAKLETVDDVTITVQSPVPSSGPRTTNGAFVGEILGTNVYTVTVDKANLIAGLKQDFVVTTKDADGNIVKPTSVTIKSTVDGFTAITSTGSGTWDGSGYKFSILPSKTETFTVVVGTDSKAKIGKVEVPVVAPTVDAGDNLVTDSLKESITVTFADGITAGGYLKITVKNATADLYVNGKVAPEKTLKSGESYEFTTLATANTFELKATDLDNNDEKPEVVLEAAYSKNTSDRPVYVEAARMEIVPAVIATDVEEIAGGAMTPVKVTLKDAHGNPIANRTISTAGVAATSGVTDDNGETTLVLNAVSTGNVKFAAEGLKGASKTIKAVADTTAPEITVDAPAQVKTDTVTVTGKATDNVKVTEVYVNGQKVLFVPGAEATIRAKIALEVGVNEIEIFAFDAAGNASTKIVTVTRVLPTVVKLGLGSADATIDGVPAAGVAPYLKDNSTMVPFRFIGEALGATVDFADVAGVQTVTLSLDGTTVVLTIGSTTAMVNGEAKTMPVAPEITNGRTMVPLRFVGEALGAYVEFNPVTSGITVTR